MAGWDDVRRISLDLPGAVEDDSGSTRAWRVGSKAFAWERVLRRGERATLTDPPEGPALGLRTADVEAVDGLVAARPEVFFTVAGYGLHPMVLVHVERASVEDLDEAITDAWMARASKRLREAFLQAGSSGSGGPLEGPGGSVRGREAGDGTAPGGAVGGGAGLPDR